MSANGDGHAADLGSWRPLPRILYGFAVFPFTPIEEEYGNDSNPYQVPLEIGSELYVFEVFRPSSSIPYTDEGSLWYRGYVVASRQSASTTASTSSSTSIAEEPSVTVGIFPATHCLIKERLEDEDARLEELRQAAAATSLKNAGPEKLSLGFGRVRSREPLAPLLEEEDEGLEEDIFGTLTGNVNTPSKARNRASVPDARLSLLGSSPAGPGSNGHRRNSSTASNPGQIVIMNGVVEDDRPAPPLPSLKTGDETAAGLDEPLIDEIACALREYSSLLYRHLQQRDYPMFHLVKDHIQALHLGRRQLLSKTLSIDELDRLRKSLVDRLVQANIQQGLDTVVRHPGWGAMADVEAHGDIDARAWMSGVRMYKMGVELAYSNTGVDDGKRIAGASAQSVLGNNDFDAPSSNATTTGQANKTMANAHQDPESLEKATLAQFYHVFVDVKALVASLCSPGETVELIFSLYNKSDNRFLTEECCIVLNHQGVPRDGRLDRARTLFKDLSQQDILDTLVLVCRIVINGSLRSAQLGSNFRSSTNLSSPYGSGSGYASQSFTSPILHSSTTLDLHGHNPRDLNGSTSANSMTSQFEPGGSRTYRRPFGCSVVEISQLFRVGQSSSSATELTMPIFVPINESSFSTLHEDIIASRIQEFQKSPRAENLTIGLRVFHEDVNATIRDNPSLMQDTPLTSRLGFPDVVFPDDQRNDVYVKLWTGEFPSLGGAGAGGKLATRGAGPNVEVEVEIRNRDGGMLGYAISRGAGEANVSRFTSMIFRNNAAPTWGELLKLDIPFQHMHDCHLFFTFRNRRDRSNSSAGGMLASPVPGESGAERPFAFAYLPLFGRDQAFLSDGSHQLLLYRYDPQGAVPTTYFEGSATIASGSGFIPPIPATLARVLVPLRDSLTIRSFLCSTQLTQDPTLLKLLSWEKALSNNPDELKNTLLKLRYSPEFECIKMITQVFDSLFAILSSTRSEGGEIDDLVFQAIVTLLGLVKDRRYSNFRPVLDVYIEKYFSSSTAFTHLIRGLQKLVNGYANPEFAQSLRSSIKVWSHLFKLIVRSRQIQRNKQGDMSVTADHLESAFRGDVKALLNSINAMMSATHPPSVIGTQTLAVQHFASIISDLSQCFNSEELADIAIEFCDSIISTKTTMAIQKVLLQGQLVTGPLMQSASARTILIPNVCRWLKPHLGSFDELRMFGAKDTESTKDVMRVAWLEATRLSVSVVAAILDKLHACIVDPQIRVNRNALAQEQDSIEFVLSLLPRLLESYRELQNPAYLRALERNRSSASIVAKVPTVFPSIYPTSLLVEPPPSSTSQTASPSLQSLRGEIAATVVVLLYIAPPNVFQNYLDSSLEVEGQANSARFLGHLFRFGTSLLQYEAFPSRWLNINMLAHKAIIRIADPCSSVLTRHYVPDQSQAATFNTSLWRDFFTMLLKLLSSPSLVIEEFSPARQRAVWRLAGDLRGEGSKILLKSWNALSWTEKGAQQGSATVYGGYQVGLTNMVEPILELCLSHHDELRNTAVNILYSLIISEFYLNDGFHSIENEVLDRLDKLFSHKKGDEISRAFFITQLRSLFHATNMDVRLREQVEAFLDSINHFLELLLGIRNLPESEEWQDDRVIGTLKLMAFIEKRHRSIFIRYVHRLVEFHVASNQLTEAGLTLKLHADLYRFDTSSILPAVDELDLPQQSEFGRKELLYLRILQYLSKGKAYETAIAISKELQVQYEQHVFAYQRLSELLTHQADLFAGIMTQTRYFAPAFRVGFYGRGFPLSVQNKQFVYRGFEWEKYGSFCERMQNKHANAQLLRSNIVPALELQTSDERYLLITAVTPEPDRTLPIFTNPDVPLPVRAYYENNETRTFSYTRVLDKAERALIDTANDISQYTEKTYLICAEAFPTILRRTEVVDIQTVELSPIESAIIEVKGKTTDLDSLHRRYISLNQAEAGPSESGKINTNPLSMQLNSCVDMGSNSGVPLYRKAFFDSAFIAGNPDKLGFVTNLKTAIDEQVRTIAKCLILHESLCPPDMANFHATLIRFFERNFSEEICRMGESLDYKLSPALLSPQTAYTGSPSSINEAFTPRGANATSMQHSRTFSNSTITSGGTHLAFALLPLSNIDEHSPGQLTRARAPAPLERASSMYSNSPLDGSPAKPSAPNGVHFAPTPSIQETGRSSPAPSGKASTLNATITSDRPMSLLGRFNSMRRKK